MLKLAQKAPLKRGNVYSEFICPQRHQVMFAPFPPVFQNRSLLYELALLFASNRKQFKQAKQKKKKRLFVRLQEQILELRVGR